MRVLMALVVAALMSPTVTADTELKVGDVAPDFTLQASDGQSYTLSEFKGKQAVALAWFPKAFTQGCTIECKSLAENGHLIKKYDVAYFMISVDDIEGDKGNKAFAESQDADFPLLGDPSKQTATAYGVLRDFGGEYGEMAQRWTFYIGTNGKILAIDKAVKPATSAEDMATQLGSLEVAMR
tara:strand:- start:6604 stop:7149 length:546 start_codon:yes stop_codon:yes gene_type:complete